MDDLLRSAVQLRQAESNRQKARFVALPPHQQNTLFHEPDITALRALPSAERLAAAERLRAAGSAALRDGGDAHAALRLYEQAYSVLRFVAARTADWRTRGIRDADLDWHGLERPPAGPEEAALLISVLCNMAIALQRGAFGDGAADLAHAAATAVLEEARSVDPASLRAAFLLARALSGHPTSTTLTTERAVAALRDALARSDASEPSAQREDCVALVASLQAQLAEQQRRDRRSFGGMFDRGAAAAAPASSSAPGEQPSTWVQQAQQCRDVAAMLRRRRDAAAAGVGGGEDDDEEAAERLEAQLADATAEKLWVETMRPARCHDAADPRVVSAAAALGVALPGDALVVAALQRRARAQRAAAVDHMHLLDVEMELWLRDARAAAEAGGPQPAPPPLCAADWARRRAARDFDHLVSAEPRVDKATEQQLRDKLRQLRLRGQ